MRPGSSATMTRLTFIHTPQELVLGQNRYTVWPGPYVPPEKSLAGDIPQSGFRRGKEQDSI